MYLAQLKDANFHHFSGIVATKLFNAVEDIFDRLTAVLKSDMCHSEKLLHLDTDYLFSVNCTIQ